MRFGDAADLQMLAGIVLVFAGAVFLAFLITVLFPLEKPDAHVGSIVQYTEQLSGKYILIAGDDSRIVTCEYSIPASTGKITHIDLRCIVPVNGGAAVH